MKLIVTLIFAFSLSAYAQENYGAGHFDEDHTFGDEDAYQCSMALYAYDSSLPRGFRVGEKLWQELIGGPNRVLTGSFGNFDISIAANGVQRLQFHGIFNSFEQILHVETEFVTWYPGLDRSRNSSVSLKNPIHIAGEQEDGVVLLGRYFLKARCWSGRILSIYPQREE